MIPKVIAAASLLLLAACSQPPAPPANVASLDTSGSAPSNSAPTSANPEQPRLRMDMSEEEKNRLFEAHTACLKEKDPKGTGTGPGPAGQRQYSEEAWSACALKWPLPPWEMDSKNPTFADNWHKNVRCLNDKGLKVIETEPGSWTYDGEPTMSQAERDRVTKECEQQVFGGGAK